MLGLVGSRGVGKTTLFLQHIKKHHSPENKLYIIADHMYFGNQTLYDTAESFNKVGGRSKCQKQIRDAKEGYVVKDDIENGYGNVIPIWAFGLNY